MAFFRFTRDKRGYEHFYLVEPTTNRRGKVAAARALLVSLAARHQGRPRAVRRRRAPRARSAESRRHLRLARDSRGADPVGGRRKWRERRRAERAAKQALAATSRRGSGEPAERDAVDETMRTGAPTRRSRSSRRRQQRQATAAARNGGAGAANGRRPSTPGATDAAEPSRPRDDDRPTEAGEPRKSDRDVRSTRRIWLGAVVAVAADRRLVGGRELRRGCSAIVARIRDIGPAAPMAFIAIYAAAVVALFRPRF